jgi:hypothetical protein
MAASGADFHDGVSLFVPLQPAKPWNQLQWVCWHLGQQEGLASLQHRWGLVWALQSVVELSIVRVLHGSLVVDGKEAAVCVGFVKN